MYEQQLMKKEAINLEKKPEVVYERVWREEIEQEMMQLYYNL